MKYKKIFHTQKEPHFLNVLFPTILPFDWLLVGWYFLTFRPGKALSSIQGVLMIRKLNKMAKVSYGKEYVADFYSLRTLNKTELMGEMFRFSALKNADEKDVKSCQ